MIERIERLSEYSKSIKVLYVEDDPVTREYISEFLSTIFDNLVIAIDGEDGLEKFKSNNINLVITDIMMPKLNGIQMLEEIKKINKDCHSIIISQHNEVDVLLQSIKLNVDGYILKPIEFENILDILEKITEKFKFEYESKNHQYYLEQYLTLLDKSNIISKTDTNGIITYVNDSFCRISGYERDELLGKNHGITKHHENPNELYKDMWNTIKIKEKVWEGLVKNKSKSGNSYYVRTIITPIKNIEGQVVEFIAVRNNLNSIIDDKKYLFEQIEKNKLSILFLLQINELDILEKFYNNVTI